MEGRLKEGGNDGIQEGERGGRVGGRKVGK